jgi:hypothetical protein
MSRLISTGHTVPMPRLASWTEEKRVVEMSRIRADIAAQGGLITSERRVRNVVFDDPGERTTWKFNVRWSA